MQKTKILLIAESQNLNSLESLYKKMKRCGYFRNVPFNFEISLPSSYIEAPKDREELSKYRNSPNQARTFPEGTRRILFFESFFRLNNIRKKVTLLHEVAHNIIYNSGVHKELYDEINNIEIISNYEEIKGDIKSILDLPDEILTYKWLYERWPELFHKEILYQWDNDKKNFENLVKEIPENKKLIFRLPKIIYRILFIKLIYSFYVEKKEEDLLIVRKCKNYIKTNLKKRGINWKFLFDCVNKIFYECKKERINPRKLIDLWKSYMNEFNKIAENLWN